MIEFKNSRPDVILQFPVTDYMGADKNFQRALCWLGGYKPEHYGRVIWVANKPKPCDEWRMDHSATARRGSLPHPEELEWIVEIWFYCDNPADIEHIASLAPPWSGVMVNMKDQVP